MIRDDLQRARLCRALLAPIFGDRVDRYFTTGGPTALTLEMHATGTDVLSTGERLLVQTACALWFDVPGPGIADLAFGLDARNLVRLAYVLRILASSSARIDAWLDAVESA